MALLVRMPQKGLSEESAILSEWHVREGDTVKTGDYLFSIETGKATFDVESEVDGTVLKTIGEEGDEIEVKKIVCVVGTPGESFELEDSPGETASEEEPKAAETGGNEASGIASGPEKEEKSGEAGELSMNTGAVKISPRARMLAETRGIDIRFAKGTGPEGRIIERDIEAMMETGPFVSGAAKPYAHGNEEGTGLQGTVTTADLGKPQATAEPVVTEAAPVQAGPGDDLAFTVVKNSHMRKIIAKNMHDSLAVMAQLTHNSYGDATAMKRLREEFKTKGEPFGMQGITLNDMVIFAVSRTLPEFPELNAHYDDKEMKLFKHVNIGVAVDTERGLMVPTIMRAEEKSLLEISREMKALARDCQNGSIAPEKLTGASFTVSNLGAYGITSFSPIINPPQVGILGVCGIEPKVRLKGGAPEYYEGINLSLTYDHRAIDGAPASKFLQVLGRNLGCIDMLLAK